MWRIKPDHMLCVSCVMAVRPATAGGVAHVMCRRCGCMETVEKAEDDCFVFLVATATRRLSTSGYTCRFMPLQDGIDPLKAKADYFGESVGDAYPKLMRA